MKNILLILSLLSIVVSNAQRELVYKKGKVGLQAKGEMILKPKFDSILLLDKNIATAYKGKKVVYYNWDGKAIHKGDLTNTKPFLKGMGVFKYKNGSWGILSKNGSRNVSPSFKNEPKFLNNIVYLSGGSSYSGYNLLYSVEGDLNLKNLDTVYEINENLVYAVQSGTKTEERKRLIGKKTYQVDQIYGYVINSLKGRTLSVGEDFLEKTGNIFVTKKLNYGGYNLLSPEGDFISINGLKKYDVYAFTKIEAMNGGFIKVTFNEPTHPNLLSLLDSNGKSIVPNKNYVVIKNHGNFIEARISSKTSDIYNLEGEIIKSEVKTVEKINDEKFILLADKSCYITDKLGKEISPEYDFIKRANNGLYLIHKDSSFAYVRSTDYVQVTPNFPIYTGVVRGSSGRRGFFGIGKKSGTADRKGVIFSGKQFHDGWALIAVNAWNKPLVKNKTEWLDWSYELSFNYIDTNGNRMNKQVYNHAYEFKNGKAWVFTRGYYYLLDTKGKINYSIPAEDMEELSNGYWLVESKTKNKWLLLNANYEIVFRYTNYFTPYEYEGFLKASDMSDTPDEKLYKLK